MPLSALLLALAAAFGHALWNLLLARARDTEAATALALGIGVVLFAPVAALTWEVERSVWPFVGASAAFEIAYVALLAAAYRRAELSVVYPVGRGVAPVLVLAFGAAVLGAGTSGGQALGVVLVTAGVLFVRGPRRSAGPEGVAFGLAIAVSIAAYTLVDNSGVEHASPIAYLELVMLPTALVYGSAVLALKGSSAVRAELNGATLAAGALIFVPFAFFLAALELAEAAPVAAVRETSILIATALASLFLREPVGRLRALGAALVVGGVALVSLF